MDFSKMLTLLLRIINKEISILGIEIPMELARVVIIIQVTVYINQIWDLRVSKELKEFHIDVIFLPVARNLCSILQIYVFFRFRSILF